MKAHQAYSLTTIIVGALQDMCERIEVAGSIRRGRPEVGDVDLVILPKEGQEQAIRSRIKQRTQTVTEGAETLVVLLRLPKGYAHPSPDIQLDVWFARPESRDLLATTPSNFGTLLVCRTGSKEHNIRLASRAQQLGLHWNPHRGVMRGQEIVASATEKDVFEALQLPWVPPGFREAHTNWEEFREQKPEVGSQESEVGSPKSEGRLATVQEGAAWFEKARQRIEAAQAGAGAELTRRVAAAGEHSGS